MQMSNVAPLASSDLKKSTGEQDAHVRAILAGIKALVSGLSQDERQQVLAAITDIVQPIPAPRAGELLGKIIKLIPRTGEFTVEQLKQQVAEDGVEAEPKEIYNAVSYLARKGHIRRIGYGRYVVDGVEIVTADDLGGESARHEDAYRCDPGQQREEG